MNKIWFVADLHKLENFHDLRAEFYTAWKNSVSDKDVVFILGDVADERLFETFQIISKMAGRKVLMIGQLEKRKTKWYSKFGFEMIVPINESITYRGEYGNVLITYTPANEAVAASIDSPLMGLARKFAKDMDRKSCVLNVHGYTKGVATERHNTMDVSVTNINNSLILLEQIYELKFKGG